MSRSQREEARLLTKDEHQLVGMTRRLAVKALADGELSDVIRRLAERRDRARDIAARQRREMRGKAEAAGSRPASDDSGTRAKASLLAAALKRANKERARRRAKSDLVASARKALELRKEAEEGAPKPPATMTAHEGMQPLPNTGIAPSGALEQEGHRPVLERSRKVR
jgi:hypothetical protein